MKFDRNPSLPLRLNRRAGVPPAAGRSQADSANANALCATLLLRPRRSRAGSWFRCADRKPRSLCQQGIVCITLVVFAFATVRLSASEVATAFDQANKLYEQGKYAEAAVAYDRLIQAGHTSPTIYFNLGNACFKAGHPGRAIAAYRQAESLAPRDPDVQANLNFVRKTINETAPPGTWRQHWLGRLTLNEWTLLASASLWVWLIFLAARELRVEWRKRFRISAVTVGLVAGALAICLGLAWFDRSSTRSAIIIVPEVVVRYGPLEESQSAFQLRDGTEVSVLDEKDDWLQVRDSARREGWLRRSQVVLLTASYSPTAAGRPSPLRKT